MDVANIFNNVPLSTNKTKSWELVLAAQAIRIILAKLTQKKIKK
jgi:hypothetical protein